MNANERPDFRVAEDTMKKIHLFAQQEGIDLVRPTIFVNPEVGDPVQREIPPDMWFKALGSAAKPQARVKPLATLEENGIQLNASHRAQFLRGEPILVDLNTLQIPVESPLHGGQLDSFQQDKIRQVLQITAHVVVERVRLLLSIRGDFSKQSSADALRSEVRTLLCKRWPLNSRHKEEGSRYSHLSSLQEKGRKVVTNLYPSNGTNFSTRLKLWAGSFAEKPRRFIDDEIAFQQSLLYSMLICEIFIEDLASAIIETRKLWQKHKSTALPRYLFETLSGIKKPIAHADALAAAFAGINLAEFGLLPKSYQTELQAMQLMGCIDRGQPIIFQQEYLSIFEHGLCDLRHYEQNSAGLAKDLPRQFWVKAMCRIGDAKSWSNSLGIIRAATAARLG